MPGDVNSALRAYIAGTLETEPSPYPNINIFFAGKKGRKGEREGKNVSSLEKQKNKTKRPKQTNPHKQALILSQKLKTTAPS